MCISTNNVDPHALEVIIAKYAISSGYALHAELRTLFKDEP